MQRHIIRFMPLFSLLSVAATLLYSATAHAATVTLYLSGSSSVTKGSSITLTVRENSGSTAVNAVQANLTYPASQLQFVGIGSTAAYGVVAQSTGGGGSVQIGRGTVSAVTGDQAVATVTFKALAGSGTATVAFASGSTVASSTSNTNVMTSDPSKSITLQTVSSGGGGSSSGDTSSGGTSPPDAHPSSNSPSASPPEVKKSPPKDTTPPSIADISITHITTSSVQITWQTSEAATSEVDYGLNAAYGLTAVQGSRVRTHTVSLHSPLLIPGTAYHFRVVSADKAGNKASSSDQAFVTAGATVTFTVIDQATNKPASGAIVSYGSQTATTNRNGQATLRNLPVGELTVGVALRGQYNAVALKLGNGQLASPQNVSVKIGDHPSPGVAGWIVGGAAVVLAGIAGAAYVLNRRRSGPISGAGPDSVPANIVVSPPAETPRRWM